MILDLIVMLVLFGYFGWIPAVIYGLTAVLLDGAFAWMTYTRWVDNIDRSNGRTIDG